MQRLNLYRCFASAVCLSNTPMLRWLVVAALVLVCFSPVCQGQVRKNVLMIPEFGQSHPGPALVTNLILDALHSDPRFQVEFYWESLDAADQSDKSQDEQRDLLLQKYRGRKMDLIVLGGPDPIRFLAEPSKPFFPDVPVVFCCSDPGQLPQVVADSRSTGSWLQFEPSKTLDAALGLLPETRHVFVVGGQSKYDRSLTALVTAGLKSYETRLDITYLNDLPMNQLQEKLRQLPSHSIVLYVTFFEDAAGRKFLNGPEALPMIVAASNAPVFGMIDTYLGRGVVGGDVVSVEEQGKIAARDVVAILGGKQPREIPVVHDQSVYRFDWSQLQRWKLDASKLPAGSTILFRQPTLWERHKWTLLMGLLTMVGLALLTIYLLYKQKQLKSARDAQVELSGMLINAQETERSRLAAEIHDDFSQRIAVLALGLGTASQNIQESPQEANRQLHELSNEVSAISGDLHTLSHSLHSATLERLGLASGVGAFCKEFSVQQGMKIDFTHDDIPMSINPDVALCVFRIAQEGLRNIKKHSSVSSAHVGLKIAGSTIHLSVSDRGIGFNPKELKMSEGLGVRSMAERAHLLGGRFEISSKLGKGTVIDVWLPLQPRSSAKND